MGFEAEFDVPAAPAKDEVPPPRRYDFAYAPRHAGRHNEPWRYLLGFGGVLFIGMGLQAIAGLLVGYVMFGLSAQYDWAKFYVAALKRPPETWPWELFLCLSVVTFSSFVAALAMALQMFHGRGLATVVNTVGGFRPGRFLLGFLVYGALLAVPLLISVQQAPGLYALNFEPRLFLGLLALLVPMLLIQTGFEELFFRGYLVQLVASYRAPLTWIVILPSLLFMLGHLGNSEVSAAPGVLGFYLSFGVFMTLLAYEEQGIELVFGAHFANNLVAGALIRPENSTFQTPTLFVMPPLGGEGAEGPMLTAMAGAMAPAIFYGLIMGVKIFTRGLRPGKPARR